MMIVVSDPFVNMKMTLKISHRYLLPGNLFDLLHINECSSKQHLFNHHPETDYFSTQLIPSEPILLIFITNIR